MTEAPASRSVGSVPVGATRFLTVAAIYLVHFRVSGYDRFYSDAGEYWELGTLFGREGHFSLFSFDSTRRGFAFPLFLNGLQSVAAASGIGELGIVRLTGALLAATLGVVVIPALARSLFPDAAITWRRVLAFNALIFLFWRDHFAFPLSDFPALFAAALGLTALLRKTTLGYVIAGAGFGIAANLRPAYLPAALVAVVVAAVASARVEAPERRALAPALVLGAAFLVSLPQVAINYHVRGHTNPLIADANKIALVQLTEGLRAQRYETLIDPPDRYPSTKVRYPDPLGRRVIEEESVSAITSYGQYGRIVLTHPLRMAASYALHAVNGLDVWYPTPYVRNLDERSNALSFLQFTLLFLAGAPLVIPQMRRALGPISWVGIAVLVSPTFSAIPGAVEPRFFLPVHVLVYMLVCFGPATLESLLTAGRARQAAIASAYAGFIVLCMTASIASSSQGELRRPLPASAPESSGLAGIAAAARLVACSQSRHNVF